MNFHYRTQKITKISRIYLIIKKNLVSGLGITNSISLRVTPNFPKKPRKHIATLKHWRAELKAPSPLGSWRITLKLKVCFHNLQNSVKTLGWRNRQQSHSSCDSEHLPLAFHTSPAPSSWDRSKLLFLGKKISTDLKELRDLQSYGVLMKSQHSWFPWLSPVNFTSLTVNSEIKLTGHIWNHLWKEPLI